MLPSRRVEDNFLTRLETGFLNPLFRLDRSSALVVYAI